MPTPRVDEHLSDDPLRFAVPLARILSVAPAVVLVAFCIVERVINVPSTVGIAWAMLVATGIIGSGPPANAQSSRSYHQAHSGLAAQFLAQLVLSFLFWRFNSTATGTLAFLGLLVVQGSFLFTGVMLRRSCTRKDYALLATVAASGPAIVFTPIFLFSLNAFHG